MKDAFQSSVYSTSVTGIWPFIAQRAVDGDRSGNYPSNWACIHTGNMNELAWWYVDLGAPYRVHSIDITGRSDATQEGDVQYRYVPHLKVLF